MNEPTVYVVDDDRAARDSLRWLLESVGHRVSCHASAQEFLAGFDHEAGGCVVLDVRMPGMSGLELQDQLRERGCCLPVIIVTGHGDVPMAVRAMRSGALDFLQKPYNDQVLLDSIGRALALCRQKGLERERLARIQAAYLMLSPREREVASMVVNGCANKVIAIDLGLSPKTVEAHRANAMEKMKARTLSELVRMFMALEQEGEDLSGEDAPPPVRPRQPDPIRV
ncbi:MAG TPA: response regulator transcription factor [Thiobacillaceae bacterium]|nr:response regulator transcription factor [Thiobacillaceae bacterium]HNA81465.1 response regulator transcription factor [Thiobacillaceae bacterium]HNF88466.1 response regulator transcription factor [Thiobacillaceae bacterium]HNH87994.1 response regulator transcription factor [Thiobacillaceae bacterium]HNI06715.1 response regulator transcription factor [Thiobacillaceae bacterium]